MMSRVLLAALVLVLLVPGGAYGTIWFVAAGDPAFRILDALDVAAAGDTVEVGPGIHGYYESRVIRGRSARAIGFLKSGVTVQSQAGPEVTIIDGLGWKRGFIGEDLDSTTVVRGFTFLECTDVGAEPWGGGLLAYDSALTIEGNWFVDCTAGGGAGLFLYGGANANVRGNAFVRGHAAQLGGAVELYLAQNTLLDGNTFVGNSAGNVGGAVVLNASSCVVDRNIFWRNQTEGRGGALDCYSGSTLTGTCNLFWENEAPTNPHVGDCDLIIDADGNRIANPLFCDPDADVFTLSSESFALPMGSGGCGLIGALDQGCLSTPRIAVIESTLDFADVFLGYPETIVVTVTNAGTDTLSVSDVPSNLPEFVASPSSFMLPPGTARDVDMTFAPLLPQPYSGVIQIASNDPVTGVLDLAVSGIGLVPPEIAVAAPDTIAALLGPFEHLNSTIVVSNLSGSTLDYGIWLDRVTPTGSPRRVMFLDLLWGPGEQIADSLLIAAGYDVTLVDYSSYAGSPPPGDFDVVLLDGEPNLEYPMDMPSTGQWLLRQFVSRGGGLVALGGAAEMKAYGHFQSLAPLLPLGAEFISVLDDTLTVVKAHPVTAGVAESSVLLANPTVWTSVSDGTTLVSGSGGAHSVVTDNFGSGRVIGFSSEEQTWFKVNRNFAAEPLQSLLVNSIQWASSVVAWGSADVESGVLAAGEADTVVVSFASAGLVAGTYEAVLTLMSNDPASPAMTIPVLLSVAGATAVLPEAMPAPVFALHQNSPNPFHRSTRIAFDIGTSGPVTLSIYDVRGRMVRTLVHEARTAGRHAVDWNSRDEAGDQAAPGVYFCRVASGGETHTQKMVLTR